MRRDPAKNALKITNMYLFGSYTDYEIKNLRLLLEVERKLTTESKINQIVVGLLPNIRKLLDRKDITDVESLMNTLSKFETPIKSNQQQPKYDGEQQNKRVVNQQEKVESQIDAKEVY